MTDSVYTTYHQAEDKAWELIGECTHGHRVLPGPMAIFLSKPSGLFAILQEDIVKRIPNLEIWGTFTAYGVEPVDPPTPTNLFIEEAKANV